MRQGLQAKFEREVDPQGKLSPQERAKRAEYARKAHMQRMALKSVSESDRGTWSCAKQPGSRHVARASRQCRRNRKRFGVGSEFSMSLRRCVGRASHLCLEADAVCSACTNWLTRLLLSENLAPYPSP